MIWAPWLIAIVLVLAGCRSSAEAVTIDGFTLGARVTCSPPVDVEPAILDLSCAGYPQRATAALDAREPGHPAIVSSVMYADGTQPGPVDVTGNGPVPVSQTRHPGPEVTVLVLTLADGSTRAVGVTCTDGPPRECVGLPTYPD